MSTQKIIPRKVWWGLEAKSYTEIAQELPTQEESLRKWVAIYAIYHLNFEDRHSGELYYKFLEDAKHSKYVIVEFTLPVHILETRDSVGANDTTITTWETFETEEEINSFLHEHNINPELFTPPWTCEYPLD
ncbi:hypothetical protein QIW46_19740 [Pseudomonas fluorescens]|uniref:hypothetical protein n=1 Tax=Pseudomonas fluorescens TaxID=294 RepID=UPI003526516E